MKNADFFAPITTATVFFLLLPSIAHSDANTTDYPKVFSDIKDELADLSGEFPQLREFPGKVVFNASELRLSYSFHTHRSEQSGGWTSGVPNPDDDGIWLYIDFHDPNSTAQIHAQPITLPLCVGSKKVSFLLLEGKNTKPVEAEIYSILKSHGVSDCRKTE